MLSMPTVKFSDLLSDVNTELERELFVVGWLLLLQSMNQLFTITAFTNCNQFCDRMLPCLKENWKGRYMIRLLHHKGKAVSTILACIQINSHV